MALYRRCDRCGRTNETPQSTLQFWTLIAEHTINMRNGHYDNDLTVEICTICLADIKHYVAHPPKVSI